MKWHRDIVIARINATENRSNLEDAMTSLVSLRASTKSGGYFRERNDFAGVLSEKQLIANLI
jgi:hypothetical protein